MDWSPSRGSEQKGRRPALIVQSNEANELEAYELTVVLALSTRGHSDNLMHVNIEPTRLNGLSQKGFVRCEQVMTVSKSRLDGYIGQIEHKLMALVDENLRDLLGLA